MVGNSIFSPLDAFYLKSEGLLGPLSSKGTRNLHKSLLDAYSDPDNQLSSIGIHFDFNDLEHDFSTIPDQLVSRATLEYIGFSEERALSMWTEWHSLITEEQAGERIFNAVNQRKSFEDLFTGIFETGIDAGVNHDDEEWKRVMTRFGLSNETQRAILDPRFRELRPEYSCAAWAKHKALLWYRGIESIQRASTARDTALRLVTTEPLEDPQELHSLTQLLEAEVSEAKNTSLLPGTPTACVMQDLIWSAMKCAPQ